MKPTLGLILISLVLLGSVIAAHYYLMPTPTKGVPMFNITGELEVYKNGVLVHKGPDILTNNFYYWLHNMLIGALGFQGTGIGPTQICGTPSWAANPGVLMKDTGNGGTCSWVVTGTPAVKVHFGTGTSLPQRSDYALASETASSGASIQFNAPSSTAQKANVTFTASYTASSSITISEVGLSALSYIPSTGPYGYVLMAHDQIPSQSLNAGDVLTVVYRLVAPVNFETIGSLTPLNGGTPFLGLITQCLARSTSIPGLPASATFGNYCMSTSGLAGATLVFISPDGNTQLNNQGLLSNAVSAPKITIVGYLPQSMTIGSVSYRFTIGAQIYSVITFFLTTNRDLVGGQAAGLQFSGP